MSASQFLASVPADSLRIYTETRAVVLDGGTEEVDQTYLTFEGNPGACRYLALLLFELADNAEASPNPEQGHSVILSPNDLKQITMNEFSSLALACRQQLSATAGS